VLSINRSSHFIFIFISVVGPSLLVEVVSISRCGPSCYHRPGKCRMFRSFRVVAKEPKGCLLERFSFDVWWEAWTVGPPKFPTFSTMRSVGEYTTTWRVRSTRAQNASFRTRVWTMFLSILAVKPPKNEILALNRTFKRERKNSNTYNNFYGNKNLAIANRSRVRYDHNTLRASRPKYYTMTLKSRLTVTQGRWKRNHWIDHTRFSSSRVIWRWILLWPWTVG